jgi:hypothetical protein
MPTTHHSKPTRQTHTWQAQVCALTYVGVHRHAATCGPAICKLVECKLVECKLVECKLVECRLCVG